MNDYKNIDEYISNFPPQVQTTLQKLRSIIREIVPDAKEKIAYGIPTFTFHGNLVHFAAYEHHIGFYPGSTPIKEYSAELSGYKTSKGTVQFPIDKPIPYDLVRKLTKVAINRNLNKG